MPPPLVSVLITAYNRENYIAETIESVLAQTFKDFELIIVDDGSRDHTVEIARRYAADPRVQVHVNEKNLGQFSNRNRAAGLAKGKYLKYLDSDDVAYPHCLQVMVSGMERFPDAGIGLSEPFREDIILPSRMDPVTAWREDLLGSGLFNKAPSSTIILRSAFEQSGGFHHPDALTDDTIFLYEICARFPTVLLPHGLHFYRVHPQQEASGSTHERMLEERMRYVPPVIRSPQCPLPPEEQQLAYGNLVGHFLRYCLRLSRHGNFKVAIRLVRSAGLSFSDWKWLFRRPTRPYRRKEFYVGDLSVPRR
jgi:glycosyltransferase involved in cell wall biosynthesis